MAIEVGKKMGDECPVHAHVARWRKAQLHFQPQIIATFGCAAAPILTNRGARCAVSMRCEILTNKGAACRIFHGGVPILGVVGVDLPFCGAGTSRFRYWTHVNKGQSRFGRPMRSPPLNRVRYA